ncbi:hypothetical protein CROQUDRAFT_410791 [Cronartium quercuum f. sp. fusiforme G11]|uniref:Nucleolar protein 14 n=1 Tax=Cronartium quercuum f. sp. fusiforme G11 TaxID=708437 RepID=A0A9P6NJZ7_9BASI|nr:hypothetical protein CROQUDRAFT_410791 [Cronartium quercuum f. sp. fusiforme G11]
MGKTNNGKKGSQLSQLKQSIRTSGLSRISKVPFNGRTGDRSGKKVKSSTSSATKDPEFRLKKLAEIQASQNLFDLKTSKVKFPTSNLSQGRQKGFLRDGSKTSNVRTVGKPAQSATQAHQRRVEKLLPEYKSRHKSSTFLDKRFGEGDSTLTPEEKALERFTKERQMRLPRGGKRNVFNLDDDADGLYDDDDGTGLTHGGIGLDLDGEVGDETNEDDDGILRLNKRPLNLDELDNSADENDQARKKSKAEVMSEIITKSKAHKYQRQQLKDQDEELRNDLDMELKDLRSLLIGSAARASVSCPGMISEKPDTSPSANRDHLPEDHNSVASGDHDETDQLSDPDPDPDTTSATAPVVDKDLLSKLLGSSNRSPSPEKHEERKDEDTYDRFVRELAFDARAKPSDRLKTAEEEALEEADRLRVMEQKRLSRMRGMDDEDDDDDEHRSRNKSGKAKRKPQADDLEDDFMSDQEAKRTWNFGQGLRPDGAFGASVQPSGDSSDATSEDECSSDSGRTADTESDDGEWRGTGTEHEEKNQEGDVNCTASKQSLVASASTKQSVKKTSIKRKSTYELAYTYPCPSSHADFLSILTQMSVKSSDLPTVVQRIRVLYHPSLAEDNKAKLAIFTNVLIDHVIHLTSTHNSSSAASPFLSVNALLPHILSLCQVFTQSAASHFVSKLVIMQKNLTQALVNQTGAGWPGLCELTLLRLIGLIWSTSDFSHPVVAPALLMICQYLSQLPVRKFRDMLSGLFMSTLVLQYEALSKRLVPEAINFLLLSLIRLTSVKVELASIPSMLPIPEGVNTLIFPPSGQPFSTSDPRPLDFASLLTKESSSDTPFPSEQDKVDTLDVVVSLLNNYSALYSSSNNYIEIFTPVLDLIKSIDDTTFICEVTKLRLKKLIGTIETQLATLKRMRQLNPLRLQSHRPIPIKSQTPQFETTFNPNQKKFNPDSAQVEVNKLKMLIKKEKKGAMRELRKDNKFLAIEKAKEKDQADLAYKSKVS